MKNINCPVQKTLYILKKISEKIKNNREYEILREIKFLVEKISKGIGSRSTIDKLLKDIKVAQNTSNELKNYLSSVYLYMIEHKDVFENHVESKCCNFDECALLRIAPCQKACPAGIDIPTFINLIGRKKYKEAVEVIKKDNPFPWICGIVCTHPCELNCVRARIDSSISIMDLKAFVSEMALSTGTYPTPKKAPSNGKKVAIIGGGPAGLTAAYYLALWGYKVTIIEALPVLGGMMSVGIPPYRLPREIIDKEINMILDLGVDVRLNTFFGGDVDFDSLKKEGFDATLITIGCHKCYGLNIEGESECGSGILRAIELLRNFNLGKRVYPGDRVVVVGGGNVAMDAARTCIRVGCKEVIVAYRRTESEMPANPEEVHEAKEEGVKFEFLTIPKKILHENGRVTGLVCLKAELSEPDESGRRRPVPIDGSDFVVPCDGIIPAIGQRPGIECLTNLDLKFTKKNTIEIIDPVNMMTAIYGVFAAGDAVTGPATVVQAIGGGKRAAYGIHRYLSGKDARNISEFPIRRGREPFLNVLAQEKMDLQRPNDKFLPILMRTTTLQQVRFGIVDEDDAIDEAKRCLRCDVCIRCGRCVEVCKYEVGVNALHLGYITGYGETNFTITKDVCIGCGTCARNCPTGAMQIKDIGDERILSICGTELSRNKLLFCEECGKVISTKRHIEHLKLKLKDSAGLEDLGKICPECERKKKAMALIQ